MFVQPSWYTGPRLSVEILNVLAELDKVGVKPVRPSSALPDKESQTIVLCYGGEKLGYINRQVLSKHVLGLELVIQGKRTGALPIVGGRNLVESYVESFGRDLVDVDLVEGEGAKSKYVYCYVKNAEAARAVLTGESKRLKLNQGVEA